MHPADLCFKLPENVSLEEGAMCEPLSVGVHACRRANIVPETNVLVMGAGPIGLVTMLAARAFGAPRIVIVDVDDYRLSVAKDLGADEIVKVSTNIQVSSTHFEKKKRKPVAYCLNYISQPLNYHVLWHNLSHANQPLCFYKVASISAIGSVLDSTLKFLSIVVETDLKFDTNTTITW